MFRGMQREIYYGRDECNVRTYDDVRKLLGRGTSNVSPRGQIDVFGYFNKYLLIVWRISKYFETQIPGGTADQDVKFWVFDNSHNLYIYKYMWIDKDIFFKRILIQFLERSKI